MAKSFLALFRAKKLNIAISPQRILPEKSSCTLSSLGKATFDVFWVYFAIAIEQNVQKKEKQNSYRLVFQKIAQNQKNNVGVTLKVYKSERPYQSFM